MRNRAVRALWAALLLLLLGACTTDLLNKLSEAEANDVVAALLEAQVDATKHTPDAGKTWSVQVDKADVVVALALLKAQGLPRERSTSLGEIFKKDGLLSTPTEERVRFIFGLSKELEHTLAKIDGVVVARVHVVLPNNDPLAKEIKPSSASVFIKHNNDLNAAVAVPAVKNLVMRSVEGLSYQTVNVTLLPAASAVTDRAPRRAPKQPPWIAGALAATMAALVVGFGGWVCKRRPQWVPLPLRRLLKIDA
jgi:type III secretion protein J